MKHEVYNIYTQESYHVGTSDECQEYIANYGSGWAALSTRPFLLFEGREEGRYKVTFNIRGKGVETVNVKSMQLAREWIDMIDETTAYLYVWDRVTEDCVFRYPSFFNVNSL